MCTLDVEEGGPLRPPVLVMNELQQKTVLGNKDFVGVIMIWGKVTQWPNEKENEPGYGLTPNLAVYNGRLFG